MLKLTVTALLATSSLAMLVDQKQTDTALLQETALYRSNAQIKQDTQPPAPKPPFELEWDEAQLKWYWWNTETDTPTWRDPADTATMHCCTKSTDVAKNRFICRKDGTTAHNPDHVKMICPSMSEKTGQTAKHKTQSKHGDYMCKEENGAEGGVTVRREKKIISFGGSSKLLPVVVYFFLPSMSKKHGPKRHPNKKKDNTHHLPPPVSLSVFFCFLHRVLFLFCFSLLLFSSSFLFFFSLLLLLSGVRRIPRAQS